MAKGYKGVTNGILERLTMSKEDLMNELSIPEDTGPKGAKLKAKNKEIFRDPVAEKKAQIAEIFGEDIANMNNLEARYTRVRRIQAEYAKHNPQALAPAEAEALGFFRDEFDKIDEG